jgi:MFS family permease
MEGTFRDRWLMTLCLSRVMLYALYMAYAACLPVLIDAWDMTATQAGSVSGAYMFTYAVSLVGASALSDRFGARRVFMGSAWLSGFASLAFGLFAHDYLSALLLYCTVALFQGGVYSPAVMLFAHRYPPAVRGRAVGMLIASTSLGYALSLLAAGTMRRLPDRIRGLRHAAPGGRRRCGVCSSRHAKRGAPQVCW